MKSENVFQKEKQTTRIDVGSKGAKQAGGYEGPYRPTRHVAAKNTIGMVSQLTFCMLHDSSDPVGRSGCNVHDVYTLMHVSPCE